MQTFTAPLNTTYKIECWGASGGDHTTSGRGGYVLGNINIGKSANLYIYVGGIGLVGSGDNNTVGGWNGGGKLYSQLSGYAICYSGGGATDIRLINGDWENFNSLKSRIMVAGAGGGGIAYLEGIFGGHAGGLTAPTNYSRANNNIYITGATQTSGSKHFEDTSSTPPGEDGQFGKGGMGGRWYGAGGGSGYYGGAGGCNHPGIHAYSSENGGEIGGGGGSSFISGYTGCDAIDESSTEDNIVHTGQPNHYSGKVFTNPVMIAGNASMPKPKGGTETGHSGDGYCIISWISPSL